MNEYNDIMKMLDWNNSREVQSKGIEYAKRITSLEIFLQPNTDIFNKNVWDNCAEVLSSKTDDELKPYLMQLFEWLQDMNWPGAFCIMDRLKEFRDKHSFENCFKISVREAEKLEDEVWLDNLNTLQKERSQDSLL